MASELVHEDKISKRRGVCEGARKVKSFRPAGSEHTTSAKNHLYRTLCEKYSKILFSHSADKFRGYRFEARNKTSVLRVEPCWLKVPRGVFDH